MTDVLDLRGNRQNLKLLKGKACKIVTVVTDDQTGFPVDITGNEYRLAIAVDAESAPIISLSMGAGVTITDAEQGVVEFAMTAAQTDLLDVDADIHPSTGRYIYTADSKSPGDPEWYGFLFGTVVAEDWS